MLLGRDEERLALDRLLTDARDGRSGVLALVGEAGIGKTALLDHAADRAEGMSVLRARGVESEANVPFAGLAELLRPALATIDRIPEPQAAALSGALALAPATSRDRFAIGAATLSLLAAYAESAPLLILVDDAHRLDRPTAEALLFAARRLVADPIAVLLAVREGEPSLLDGADLRILRLAGLDRATADRLLSRAAISAELGDRLFRATGGNPLALLELSAEVEQVSQQPLDAPVPISARIAEAFTNRLAGLDDHERALLTLVAASDTGDLAVLARAVERQGLELSSLARAEELGLLRLGDASAEFVHPLARAAVYATASPAERREAHEALAAALPDRDVDRRAWHLAAAAVGPSREASVALQEAGLRARARSAYSVAAAAFERSARLAPSMEERPRLLFEAAGAAWQSGDPARTVALLDELSDSGGDESLLTQVDHLRGTVALRRGPTTDGYPLVAGAAARLAATDPERAVMMFAEAVLGGFHAADLAAMVDAAERATELAAAHPSRRADFFAAMAVAIAHVFSGESERAMAAARDAVELAERFDESELDDEVRPWGVIASLWLRERDTGRATLATAAELARREGALGSLPMLLHHVARDQATTDRWFDARASYDESIRIARETRQDVELAASIAGLAWLQGRMGDEQACRASALEARKLCDGLAVWFYELWTYLALGDLELGLGRPDAALEHHVGALEEIDTHGFADVDMWPSPELVDSYLRLGRPDDARAAAVRYADAANAKGQPWALARAARCSGLVADDDAIDAPFHEALELHDQTPDLFETARTHLAYGARLRRARRRVDAREPLRAALEAFDALGAAGWADQASAELLATGETARRRDASTIDDLTPQELQISLLLASGRTTREAAASVFLSPKTVEYHLRHVYRKLGINSRDELASAFAGRLSESVRAG